MGVRFLSCDKDLRYLYSRCRISNFNRKIMHTKKLILSSLLIAGGCVSVMAQTAVKGITWNESNPSTLKLVNVDPADMQSQEIKTIVISNKKYIPNSLYHDKKNDAVYFFTDAAHSGTGGINGSFRGQQSMMVVNGTTGEQVRELPFFNSTIMAPFIIGERNQVGFIATEPDFNAYGTNDDDISMVLFDMNTGEIGAKIKLPNLSFNSIHAPFVGEFESRNMFNGGLEKVSTSLSSPCYLTGKEQLVFVAKDVMGINRMFKIDTRLGKLISQRTVSADVLDLAYNSNTGILNALYIEENNGERALKVGVINQTTGAILESLELRTLNSTETTINDGSLEFDADENKLYVVKERGTYEEVFTLTNDLELLGQVTLPSNNKKVDFEFAVKPGEGRELTLDRIIRMYPNPATSDVTISTDNVTRVKHIRVYDQLGQVVRDIDVQSGFQSNTIQVADLISGMYMVEIESDGAETVNKKLIVQ